MTLDLSKPVQTRDGRKVRDAGWFKATRLEGLPVKGAPIDAIFGVVLEVDGTESLQTWFDDGTVPGLRGFSPADLVNVPEPERTGWLVIGGAGTALYKTKEIAAHCFRGLEHDAIVEVKYRPGQGLEDSK